MFGLSKCCFPTKQEILNKLAQTDTLSSSQSFSPEILRILLNRLKLTIEGASNKKFIWFWDAVCYFIIYFWGKKSFKLSLPGWVLCGLYCMVENCFAGFKYDCTNTHDVEVSGGSKDVVTFENKTLWFHFAIVHVCFQNGAVLLTVDQKQLLDFTTILELKCSCVDQRLMWPNTKLTRLWRLYFGMRLKFCALTTLKKVSQSGATVRERLMKIIVLI